MYYCFCWTSIVLEFKRVTLMYSVHPNTTEDFFTLAHGDLNLNIFTMIISETGTSQDPEALPARVPSASQQTIHLTHKHSIQSSVTRKSITRDLLSYNNL